MSGSGLFLAFDPTVAAPDPPVIANFVATPNPVANGAPFALSALVTGLIATLTLDGVDVTAGLSLGHWSQSNIVLSANHTYTLTAVGPGGTVFTTLLVSVTGTAPPPQLPEGNVDSVTSDAIVGWAGDSTQTSVTVVIFIDHVVPTGGVIQTSLQRDDVYNYKPVYGHFCGFSSDLPTHYQDGSDHFWEVWLIDDDAGHTGHLLSSGTFRAGGSPPQPQAGLLTLWDSYTGLSKYCWNDGLRKLWRNIGGDWYDATGQAQGNTAYCTIPDGALNAVCTNLVRDWLSFGNSGAYLRPSDGANFRWYQDRAATDRPLLLVTTSTGSFTCECTAFNYIPLNSDGTAGPVQFNVVFAGGNPMCIQFDLTALAGVLPSQVSFATIQVHKVSGPTTNLQVFRVKAPPVKTDFTNDGLGFAHTLQTKAQVLAHPSVIRGGDWQADMSSIFPGMTGPGVSGNHGNVGNNPNPVYSTDPIAQRTASFSINPNQYAPVSVWTTQEERGLSKPPDVYVGWYHRFTGPNTTLQGTKIGMSASGRGGFLVSGVDGHGFRQPVDGNGQALTYGYIFGPLSSQGNGGAGGGVTRPYSSGWSLRTWHHEAPGDGNPLAAYYAMETYAYYTNPGNGSGFNNHSWNGVLFRVNKWYWIEQHVHMNTVGGTLDPYGNGVGNADGYWEIWVDGEKIEILEGINPNNASGFTSSSLGGVLLGLQGKILAHNLNIGPDELPWIDFYEGGQIQPVNTRTCDLGFFVVATQRIGVPAFSPNPAWYNGLATFTWTQIPGSAMTNFPLSGLVAKGYTNSSGQDIGFGDPYLGIFKYSGMAIDWVNLIAYKWGGGGANAWAGNEWRGLNFGVDSPFWFLATQPSASSAVPPHSGGPYGANLDGTPESFHSYWSPIWHPGTNKGWLIRWRNDWSVDSGAGNNCRVCDNPAIPAWTDIGDMPSGGSTAGGRYDGAATAIDHGTGMIYAMFPNSIASLNPVTRQYSDLFFDGSTSHLDQGCFAAGDGVVFGLYTPDDNNVQTYYYRISDGFKVAGSLQGPDANRLIAFHVRRSCVTLYDKWTQTYWVWQDATGELFKLTQIQPWQWSVTVQPIAGFNGPGAGAYSNDSGSEGPRGNVAFADPLKGIILMLRHNQNAWFIKTS